MEALRTFVLFAHLLLCALALASAMNTDMRLMLSHVSHSTLQRQARLLTKLLIGLWATGAILILIDMHLTPGTFWPSSKLWVKLIVVLVLTGNGVILHRHAFPLLTRRQQIARTHAYVVLLSGSISASHWLLAAYIGVAKPLSNLDLLSLLALYGVLLVCLFIGSLMLTGIGGQRITDWKIREALARKKYRARISRRKSRVIAAS